MHCTRNFYPCSGILLVSIVCTSLRTTSKSAFRYYLILGACVPLVGSTSCLGTCDENLAFLRSARRGSAHRNDSFSSTTARRNDTAVLQRLPHLHSVWSVEVPTTSIVGPRLHFCLEHIVDSWVPRRSMLLNFQLVPYCSRELKFLSHGLSKAAINIARMTIRYV